MHWFKHDSNANTDEKLQSVLLDYGLEGYGLYWYCIELIVNRLDKDNINFQLKHDARIIARNTGSSEQKVSEMMKRFCDLGLFEVSNGHISCLKIAKRLDSSMTSNVYMREIIKKAKEYHDGIMTASGSFMQEEIRLDEKRRENKPSGKKLKLNLNYEDYPNFLEFWSKYKNSQKKYEALLIWHEINPPTDIILDSLLWQNELWSKDDYKYVPMATTYLNQKRWQDEKPAHLSERPF